MYGRLVHIRIVGFEKNKVYFATQQEFETLISLYSLIWDFFGILRRLQI